MNKKAVLLVNLGSPDAPTSQAVRRYLNQFLMDASVIDLPWLWRRLLVSLCILPVRSQRSAALYKRIWTSQGAPLKVIGSELLTLLKERVSIPVALAMRYGNPSISEALRALEIEQVDKLYLMPLYPHYAMSTVESVVIETRRLLSRLKKAPAVEQLPVFYQHPDYIEALVASAAPYLAQSFDHLLFSYHGLPVRHLTKYDPSQHCLVAEHCCETPHPRHAQCYRHQVFATTRAFVQLAAIRAGHYSLSFQSRLGVNNWLEPATEDTLVHLAERGVRRLLVICPAFVADCLETLEEINIRGRQQFLRAGGQSLTLIPALNTHPHWVSLLAKWIDAFATSPNSGVL